MQLNICFLKSYIHFILFIRFIEILFELIFQMLKTSRKLNELEKYFLYTKENIQFAVEVSKPDLIPKVIRNIKNYNLGLHLKLDELNFVWHNDPIPIHTIPSGIKNPKEACNFVDSIKFDYNNTFSVIAANEKFVAVSVSHMVCDGGFFKDIYGKLLDDNSYSLKPHVPMVATDFFQSELAKITQQDIKNDHELMGQVTTLNWGNNYKQLYTEENQNLKCNYYVDESPVEDFQFHKSKVNLNDLYTFSLALSIMGLNGQLHSNFGTNTCVDLRQFIPMNKRNPLNTQNTSIVSVVVDNVKPKMTVREVITSLHQKLIERLNDGSSYATLQCFFKNDFPAGKECTSSPELSNVGRFLSNDDYAAKITDTWIQQMNQSKYVEGNVFLLCFSKMKNGKNTLVTRFQQPRSVMSNEEANLMIKSIMHLMKEMPVDVSVQEAYDELRRFQKSV